MITTTVGDNLFINWEVLDVQQRDASYPISWAIANFDKGNLCQTFFTLRFNTSLFAIDQMDCPGDYAKFMFNLGRSPASRRWRLAFNTIYSCRALFSIALQARKKRETAAFSSIQVPYTVLRIEKDGNDKPYPMAVDQHSLTKVVKERSLDVIQQLGGVHGLAKLVETSIEQGIGGEPRDILRRQQLFGSNTFQKPTPRTFLSFVREGFKDTIIIILLVCVALSLGFGLKEDGIKEGWYDGGSILIAVFLVIVVGALSNYRQSRQFVKLERENDNIKVDIIRHGRRQQGSIFDIVVGDIVCLKIGDQVPADGLFVDGHSLTVDESSMTGESDHVHVDGTRNPFLISGAKVVDGYGRMLVTSVGMNTTWGEMMSTITRAKKEETPLQARLSKLATHIGKAGLAVASAVLIVLLVRYFAGASKDDNGRREFTAGKTKISQAIDSVADIIAAAVTIVVVAIPEGLPLAVTLTLAYSMKRMMFDQAMVRTLPACETMGSATTICTDKTGTLTMNQMQVTKCWVGEEAIDVKAGPQIDSTVQELIHEGVGMNTTGDVYKNITGSSPNYEFSGSPTEKALLSWAVLDMGMSVEDLRRQFTIVHVEAFNSEKKRSGVLLRQNDDQSIRAHWKGAAEMILEMCSHYLECDGTLKPMDARGMNMFERLIQGMAAHSLRCIAFAYGKMAETDITHDGKGAKLPEQGLTMLGLVGIKDPCRTGVKEAVESCQIAGIKLKMITGDNVVTATAIAIECGILKRDQNIADAVVEGKDFRNFSPEERMQKVDKICVMARSSPMDKLLMVQCLKQKGEVVCVTGDGTNDAPALKEADVGLAMGIQGTEVAKGSSDIVILDDNFATIVTVLRWGRCVYNNIQKFLQFQLTVNVAAVVINFIAAVSSGEVPLTTVQLLWVNLIMDTLGALALATERPTKELMNKKPVGRTEPIITNVMWRNLLAQALYQIAVLLTLQFRGSSIFGVTDKVKNTLIFNTFVLCQIFNEFNARKIEKKNVFQGIIRNKLFVGIVGITIILQVLMVEFLKKFADTERLNWGQWGACIAIASVSWPLAWVVKFIPMPDKPLFG